MENNIKDLVREVLEKGYVMSLGTLDENGVWVADVTYVYDENFNLYWISDPNTRHSKAILNNKKAAGTITVSVNGEKDIGAQFEGIAEKLNGPQYELAKKHYAKRAKKIPKETDDILGQNSWYMLRPVKIELIYEKYYGFEKKSLEI